MGSALLVCHTTSMPNPTFIGLVHSILSSAEAALGEINSPMVKHLMKDGALSRRTGEKSLALLEMLQEKTLGNLDETERASLYQALQSIRQRLEASTAPDDDISSMHN